MKAKLLRRIFLLVLPFLSVALHATAQAPNTISTIAGGGTNPSSATQAIIPYAVSVVRDPISNNTYVSSPVLNLIYKITPSGQLSVYAGSGNTGFSGDGGLAALASLNRPTGLVLDSASDLYFADSNNNRIRRVDATTGVITTIAGSSNQPDVFGLFGGYSGDG